MTDEERKYCKNPIVLKLANKLNKSGGHYVSVNLKESKFGICKFGDLGFVVWRFVVWDLKIWKFGNLEIWECIL